MKKNEKMNAAKKFDELMSDKDTYKKFRDTFYLRLVEKTGKGMKFSRLDHAATRLWKKMLDEIGCKGADYYSDKACGCLTWWCENVWDGVECYSDCRNLGSHNWKWAKEQMLSDLLA